MSRNAQAVSRFPYAHSVRSERFAIPYGDDVDRETKLPFGCLPSNDD